MNPHPKSYFRVLPLIHHEVTASLVLLSDGCCFSLSLLPLMPLILTVCSLLSVTAVNHFFLPLSPQSTGRRPREWKAHLHSACHIHLPTGHFPFFTKGHGICFIDTPCTLSSITTKTIYPTSCCLRWVQKGWIVQKRRRMLCSS